MSDALERVRGQWGAGGGGGAKWDEKFSSNMGRVTELLLDRAGVSHGGRVIDLACGAGAMAFAAAKGMSQDDFNDLTSAYFNVADVQPAADQPDFDGERKKLVDTFDESK